MGKLLDKFTALLWDHFPLPPSQPAGQDTEEGWAASPTKPHGS